MPDDARDGEEGSTRSRFAEPDVIRRDRMGMRDAAPQNGQRAHALQKSTVQGGPSPGDPGWVDLYFGSSLSCRPLL